MYLYFEYVWILVQVWIRIGFEFGLSDFEVENSFEYFNISGLDSGSEFFGSASDRVFRFGYYAQP